MKRADQRKIHYLYKITRSDGRFYIGIHSTENIDDGYFGSGSQLAKSIRKHGKEKHSKEILEFFESRDLLKEREKIIVDEAMLKDPRCMNMKTGGYGNSSEDSKRVWTLPGMRDRIPRAIKASWTPERRVAHGLAVKKRLSDPVQLERLSKAVSKVMSKLSTNEDYKKSHSDGAKKMWDRPEYIEKRKALCADPTYRAKKSMKGKFNPSYGKIWVTDCSVSMLILPEQLESYLAKGFRRGMSKKK